jgi:hypothetical protein
MNIMVLHKWGRRKIGKKFYTEFRTVPRYRKEALEALKQEWKEVRSPKTEGKWIIILVRGSRF